MMSESTWCSRHSSFGNIMQASEPTAKKPRRDVAVAGVPVDDAAAAVHHGLANVQDDDANAASGGSEGSQPEQEHEQEQPEHEQNQGQEQGSDDEQNISEGESSDDDSDSELAWSLNDIDAIGHFRNTRRDYFECASDQQLVFCNNRNETIDLKETRFPADMGCLYRPIHGNYDNLRAFATTLGAIATRRAGCLLFIQLPNGGLTFIWWSGFSLNIQDILVDGVRYGDSGLTLRAYFTTTGICIDAKILFPHDYTVTVPRQKDCGVVLDLMVNLMVVIPEGDCRSLGIINTSNSKTLPLDECFSPATLQNCLSLLPWTEFHFECSCVVLSNELWHVLTEMPFNVLRLVYTFPPDSFWRETVASRIRIDFNAPPWQSKMQEWSALLDILPALRARSNPIPALELSNGSIGVNSQSDANKFLGALMGVTNFRAYSFQVSLAAWLYIWRCLRDEPICWLSNLEFTHCSVLQSNGLRIENKIAGIDCIRDCLEHNRSLERVAWSHGFDEHLTKDALAYWNTRVVPLLLQNQSHVPRLVAGEDRLKVVAAEVVRVSPNKDKLFGLLAAYHRVLFPPLPGQDDVSVKVK